VEHPLLVAEFGVSGGIYRVYAADLTPLLICLKGVRNGYEGRVG